MFWKKKNQAPTLRTIEDGIRYAMEYGISAHGVRIERPFKWKDSNETVERQLQGLTDLAVELRQKARDYPILYEGGAARHFNMRLMQFVSDENFKRSILSDFTERELEVQRSRAMVEAVRAGKDTHPHFLTLVEAKSLEDIRRAESILKRA